MLTAKKHTGDLQLGTRKGAIPRLTIAKNGIVSRGYTVKYSNGFRDFSDALPGVLALLDKEGCDTVLFSLYSIVSRKSFRPFRSIRLRNIRTVLYEEFTDGIKRKMGRYVVFHRRANKWHEYALQQKFGSLTGETREKIVVCT
jgi:hypothetical protein